MDSRNEVIKTKNVTYYINGWKKVVVAVLKCDKYTPVGIFNKAYCKAEYKNDTLGMYITDNGFENILVKEKYVGIAKCSDNDEFDVEFGMKLALARAKEKKLKDVHRQYFKFVDALDDLSYVIGKKETQLHRQWIDAKCEIDGLLMEVGKKVKP